MKGYRMMLTRVRWSLVQRGVLGTLKIALGRIASKRKIKEEALAKSATHPFDVEYGVDTSGLIGGVRLFTGHQHDIYNAAYWGVAPSRAREVLRRWVATIPPGRRIEDYTFADVGCGKGRMVLIASELPFKEAVGVELNPELAQTAEKNASAWTAAGRARSPIRIAPQDATEMALPEGPCVLYFYNPFEAPVMQKMLQRLDEHFAGRPGELDVLYLFPKFDSLFAERPEYKLLWRAEISESEEDRAVDPGVSSSEHPCSAYRR